MSEEDLFGSDSSSEEENDEEMKKQMEAARKKIESKEKKARSMIVWEISPEGADDDLDKMEKDIKAIDMDGLSWGEGVKKEPFIYGMYKLILVCTIVDSKVETTSLEEALEAVENVKSIKIRDWQKM